ncbi:MAG: ATP-binding protein [Candidatus Methanoplasma sp.]|jgi:predicted AAA+ superfamily ATPase|nr:ATP-binding protein [Candidatus Methanoplasma sp.]
MNKKFVLRSGYLEKLSAFRDNTDFIKVIKGVRRCGKSTLMTQFIDILRSDGVPADRIFRFNLEDPEFFSVRTGDDLAAMVFPVIPKGVSTYVFFDEIQRAEGWERVINSLTSSGDADIYITGSNAHMLSSELTTYLTGRYASISMLPLSFAEWKELRGEGMDDATAIRRYMVYGGFPAINPALGDEAVRTAIRDLYASVVKWDVASRGQIRNMEELDRLMAYLMHNIGNPISLNNIVEGMGASRELVDRYIDLMREAFIIYRADRYDMSSSSLNPSPKYYAVDPGLREMAVGFTQKDTGRVLENVVYLELIRRGYTVQVGKYGAKEVDFVASPNVGGREYYQVCFSLSDEATMEREIPVLSSITDSFPKTILTLDPVVKHFTEDGISIIYVVDWLLQR